VPPVLWILIVSLPTATQPAIPGATSVQIVAAPETSRSNPFYVSNRRPLAPSPLVKLPIGSIEPRGWLRSQLARSAEGFTGRLPDVSRFLHRDGNAWLSPTGEGRHGWEEVPYWLKGFGDLGYVLGDERIIAEARFWIDAVLAGQRADGYFGPRSNLTSLDGKPDLWPHMVMLNVLQSYHEFCGDARVLDLMTRYFRWELSVPEADFLVPYWQQQRASDNLASVYWLYNRTGEPWLLELAAKIHRRSAPWTERVANWHGVNIAQAFRGPAVFYQQSLDAAHRRAAEQRYDEVMAQYGQVPGGMFGADENCRRAYTGPRQGAETCTMVEYMLSFEMLLKITGDLRWADRCEDVAFNSLPASMTADLKALRYLTSPNLVRSDSRSKAPGVQNSGPMFLFDPYGHRCCQHNAGHGWPYFAEHLWMATPDCGLALVLIAPSRVRAKAGNGDEATIGVETRYPFEETVSLSVEPARPASFPLYLRVPGWCVAPRVSINGQPCELGGGAVAGKFVRIEREWRPGDRVKMTLPMKVAVRRWETNHDSVSIDRGPLTYSLKIGEETRRVGGTDAWPAFELHPTTPWNYGLLLDERDPAASFETVMRDWPADDQPFASDASPIELHARARRIANWREDRLGLVGLLQPSPARSVEPTETVSLIPMGAARLRIAAFPTISDGPTAHEWALLPEPPEPIPASASHCWLGDTTDALSDGLVPSRSDDTSVPRFTWWDHRGTAEWVQYDFPTPRRVSAVQVYWYDDRDEGKCRPPARWRLRYAAGGEWCDVAARDAYGVNLDQFNRVSFDPVETAKLRIEVELQPGYSAGILQWQVE
jgi:hypothetical protein